MSLICEIGDWTVICVQYVSILRFYDQYADAGFENIGKYYYIIFSVVMKLICACETESCHDFVVIDGAAGCRYDSLR